MYSCSKDNALPALEITVARVCFSLSPNSFERASTQTGREREEERCCMIVFPFLLFQACLIMTTACNPNAARILARWALRLKLSCLWLSFKLVTICRVSHGVCVCVHLDGWSLFVAFPCLRSATCSSGLTAILSSSNGIEWAIGCLSQQCAHHLSVSTISFNELSPHVDRDALCFAHHLLTIITHWTEQPLC